MHFLPGQLRLVSLAAEAEWGSIWPEHNSNTNINPDSLLSQKETESLCSQPAISQTRGKWVSPLQAKLQRIFESHNLIWSNSVADMGCDVQPDIYDRAWQALKHSSWISLPGFGRRRSIRSSPSARILWDFPRFKVVQGSKLQIFSRRTLWPKRFSFFFSKALSKGKKKPLSDACWRQLDKLGKTEVAQQDRIFAASWLQDRNALRERQF